MIEQKSITVPRKKGKSKPLKNFTLIVTSNFTTQPPFPTFQPISLPIRHFLFEITGLSMQLWIIN